MFDEINTILSILALLVSLGYPLWSIAVIIWVYFFTTNKK